MRAAGGMGMSSQEVAGCPAIASMHLNIKPFGRCEMTIDCKLLLLCQ